MLLEVGGVRQMSLVRQAGLSEAHLPGFDGATGWLNSPAAHAGGPAREGRPRRLLDVHLHQLAAHARLRPRVGREVRGSGAGRGRRPHAGVPVRARRRQRPLGREGRCASSIRSRSTATTRSGAPSPTTTGRPCTSPTRKDESGTTSSARAATRSARWVIQHAAARGRRRGRRPTTWSRSLDEGFEAQADWPNLGSPETYLGYEQGQNFASPAAPSSTSRRTTSCRTVGAQPVGARPGTGRSGRASVLNGAERADRVPLPRPRRQPRHGPA